MSGRDHLQPALFNVPTETRKPLPPKYDPGPNRLRGGVIPGQRVMDLTGQEEELEIGAVFDDYAGIPTDVIDEKNSAYPFVHTRGIPDDAYYRFGGAIRTSGPDTPESPHPQAQRHWENTPLRTFDPETVLRTGQMEVSPSHAEDVRQAPRWDANPWIAQVGGENYVLEGHHRISAGRRRGTGEVQAHTIEAPDWQSFYRKFPQP